MLACKQQFYLAYNLEVGDVKNAAEIDTKNTAI